MEFGRRIQRSRNVRKPLRLGVMSYEREALLPA
jgi:hypothetical protein